MLTAMSLPLDEAKNVPGYWFTAVYYLFSGLVVGLSGVVVTVVLMLMTTITRMIRLFAPSDEDADDVSEDARKEQERESRHDARARAARPESHEAKWHTRSNLPTNPSPGPRRRP